MKQTTLQKLELKLQETEGGLWFICLACQKPPSSFRVKVLPCFHFVCNESSCRSSLELQYDDEPTAEGIRTCPTCEEPYKIEDLRDAVEEINLYKFLKKKKCCNSNQESIVFCDKCNLNYCEICLEKHQGIPSFLEDHIPKKIEKCFEEPPSEFEPEVRTDTLSLRSVCATVTDDFCQLIYKLSRLRANLTKLELDASRLGLEISTKGRSKLKLHFEAMEKCIRSVSVQGILKRISPLNSFIEDYLKVDPFSLSKCYKNKYKIMIDKFLDELKIAESSLNFRLTEDSLSIHEDYEEVLRLPEEIVDAVFDEINATSMNVTVLTGRAESTPSDSQVSLPKRGRGRPPKPKFGEDGGETVKVAASTEAKRRSLQCTPINVLASSSVRVAQNVISPARSSPRIKRAVSCGPGRPSPKRKRSMSCGPEEFDHLQKLEIKHYETLEILEQDVTPDTPDGQEATCGICMDGGALILCDGRGSNKCVKSFHMGQVSKNYNQRGQQCCHIPQLEIVPTGEWQCFFCLDADKLKEESFLNEAGNIYHVPSKEGLGANLQTFLIACKFLSELFAAKECLVVRLRLTKVCEESYLRSPLTLNKIRDRLLNFKASYLNDDTQQYSSIIQMVGDLNKMMKKAKDAYAEKSLSRDFKFFDRFRKIYEEKLSKFQELFPEQFPKDCGSYPYNKSFSS